MNATKRNNPQDARHILEAAETRQTLRGFTADLLERIASDRRCGLRRSLRPVTEDGLLRQIRRCIANQIPLPS